MILAGFYRLNFQSTQHVQLKNGHFTEAQLETLEQIEQELDDALSPIDDYIDTDEDTMPMPNTDPFSDLFSDQTTVVTEPPSFDAMVQQLKNVLRVLRDNHHVDQVSFNLDEGLNIYRRQNIRDTLD